MIGILYICTGKYVVFWKDFFRTCEKYFLPGQQKTYFVFTDAPEIFAEKNSNVEKYYQESLGWPNNTLLRFDIFLKHEGHLKKCDYLFFINANVRFVRKINNDILPEKFHDGLMAVLHPGYFNKTNESFTYERNPESTAYIPFGAGKHYFMGGFNGGETAPFLKLIKTLNENIHKDLDNNIIAIWHDESHLNHYLLNKNPKVLSPAYGYPHSWNLPFTPRLFLLDKAKYGGLNYLRNDGEFVIYKHNKVSSFFSKTRQFSVSVLKKILKHKSK